MKKSLLFIPVVLSLAVLGAHFLRYGNEVGVVLSLAPIALLFETPTMKRIYRVR